MDYVVAASADDPNITPAVVAALRELDYMVTPQSAVAR